MRSPFGTTLRWCRKSIEKVDVHPMRRYMLLAVVDDVVLQLGRWQSRFDTNKVIRDARRAAIVQNWTVLPTSAVEID